MTETLIDNPQLSSQAQPQTKWLQHDQDLNDQFRQHMPEWLKAQMETWAQHLEHCSTQESRIAVLSSSSVVSTANRNDGAAQQIDQKVLAIRADIVTRRHEMTEFRIAFATQLGQHLQQQIQWLMQQGLVKLCWKQNSGWSRRIMATTQASLDANAREALHQQVLRLVLSASDCWTFLHPQGIWEFDLSIDASGVHFVNQAIMF